jgi:hypothetical protein
VTTVRATLAATALLALPIPLVAWVTTRVAVIDTRPWMAHRRLRDAALVSWPCGSPPARLGTGNVKTGDGGGTRSMKARVGGRRTPRCSGRTRMKCVASAAERECWTDGIECEACQA